MRIEEQYEDVLQNIEWALLSMISKHPELTDHDMLRIIEKLITYYKYRQRGNAEVSLSTFSGVLQEIYENVISISEWRLGNKPLENNKINGEPITTEELLLCLKRIEKSIKFWTARGGRCGYIDFVAPHVFMGNRDTPILERV